jgi:hypothetical protein
MVGFYHLLDEPSEVSYVWWDFQVHTTASVKMAVSWAVAPCSLVEDYQCFEGACCLHHQGDYTAQQPRRPSSSFLYLLTGQWTPCTVHVRCSTDTGTQNRVGQLSVRPRVFRIYLLTQNCLAPGWEHWILLMVSTMLVTTVTWPRPPTFSLLKSIFLPYSPSSDSASPQYLFKKHINNYSPLYLSLPTVFSELKLPYTFLLFFFIQSYKFLSFLLSLVFNVFKEGEELSRPSTHTSQTQWSTSNGQILSVTISRMLFSAEEEIPCR